MPDVLVSMGIALTAVALDDALGTSERAFRRRRLQDRTPHTYHAIYQLYYADSGIPEHVVTDIWRDVAGVLHVEAGRLRPGDRIVGSLGYHKKLRSSRSDIEALLKLVHARMEDGNLHDVRRLHTLDDVVRGLAAARRAHPVLARA